MLFNWFPCATLYQQSYTISRCYITTACSAKMEEATVTLILEKKLIQEFSNNWSNCTVCLQFHNNHLLRSTFVNVMVLKWLELPVTPSILWSVKYSEGTSIVPAHFSQCYRPIQYYKHLVPLNLQPYTNGRSAYWSFAKTFFISVDLRGGPTWSHEPQILYG